MKKKTRIETAEPKAPAPGANRNFVQVPPMPKPIPVPKAKGAQERASLPDSDCHA